MSEKIYAWLLRLYPSSFRKAYGEEALQLFRDRAREERGFASRVRLWVDLLFDLAISVPRSYRTFPAKLTVAKGSADGAPSFLVLEEETLGFGSLVYGGMAAVVVYGSLLALIGRGGHPLSIRIPEMPQAPSYAGGVVQPAPTVVLSCSSVHPGAGAVVHLTATVLAVGSGPIPNGHVRFFDGSTALTDVNSGRLENGTVTVRAELPQSATHELWAIYYGDVNYRASNSLDHGR